VARLDEEERPDRTRELLEQIRGRAAKSPLATLVLHLPFHRTAKRFVAEKAHGSRLILEELVKKRTTWADRQGRAKATALGAAGAPAQERRDHSGALAAGDRARTSISYGRLKSKHT